MKFILKIQAISLIVMASGQIHASDSDEIFALATDLSKCVGFYTFMSDFSKSQGDKAAAEHLHNMANGARTSAAYSLSLQYAADNPNKPPKKFMEFESFVNGRSEAIYTQLEANYEANQAEPIKELADRCSTLSVVQEEILNMIRKQIYLPKSD